MTYPEAGPSRSVPPPRRDEPGRPPWPRRGDDDRDRDDGRSRLSEPSTRPSPGNWSRPPSRSYRPGTGARSNTPSPTRRFDRDRFTPDTRRGPGPGTGLRDRDWDNRRWDRDRRDDRFRDFSPPRGGPSSSHRPSPQPPSYGGTRPHSPPRGPRVFSNGTPSTLNQSDRASSGARPPNGNASTTQYKGTTAPSSTNGAGTVLVPRAPRSMRGSSSPVELRHSISDTAGPSSVPSRTVDLPNVVKEEVVDDNDLEEGEVVSPVRRPLEPIVNPRPGDRWQPPPGRRSLSPRKRRFVSRRASPDPRDRDRDRARGWDRDGDRDRDREWRSYRRSLSPIATRPNLDRQDSGRSRERSPPKPRSPSVGTNRLPLQDRPSTPPIPSPVNRLHSSLGLVGHEVPDRPDTPRLPDPSTSATQASGSEQEPLVDRPRTPELPVLPATPDTPEMHEQEGQTPHHSPERLPSPVDSRPDASVETGKKASEDDKPDVNGLEPITHSLVEDPSVKVHHPTAEGKVEPGQEIRVDSGPQNPVDSSPEVAQTVVHPVAPNNGAPLSSDNGPGLGDDRKTTQPAMDQEARTKVADVETEQTLDVQDKDDNRQETIPSTFKQLVSPPVSRITIAERRSVKLPETAVPLSSPFGARIRKDSMPTAGSNHTSNTDPETEGGPRTAEIKEDQPSPDMSEGAAEEYKRINIAKAIKRAAKHSVETQEEVDLSHIYLWNKSLSTAPSTRASGRHRSLQEITYNAKQDPSVVAFVVDRIGQEKKALKAKVERLQLEYQKLNNDWLRHCEMLDAQMALRGPPPDDLYGEERKEEPDIAGAGPALASPGNEETLAGRATSSRRRGGLGGGDGAVSEAHFMEILATFEEEAAKDPLNRAHKTAATVPDMLLGPDRNLLYDDDNDLVTDPTTFYDFAGKLEPIWTPEEKGVFRRVYPNCAKQFGKVADKLPNKSVGDCVQYYYRTKKDIDWKGLVAAKKGGERKKSRAAVKKPGKSSALLADLERHKPTANPNSNAPGKSTITPARTGKGSASGSVSRQRDGVATPLESGNKRRAKTNTLDILATAMADGVSSESTSRAGSEIPTAAKAKMRMSIKGKRPRVSSMTGIITTVSGSATAEVVKPELEPGTSAPTDPQAELLPPPKRPGKRRKTVLPGGPTEGGAAPDTPGGAPGDKPAKPRRGNTNSYWSVDEKQQIHDHYTALGPDFEQIASRLPGKSLRQVTRQVKKQMMGWLDPDAGPGPGGDGQSTDRTGTHTSRPLSVDIYGHDYSNGQMQQPRLGTFPTAQTKSPPSFSRPGGMQISNLLNNDEASTSAGLKLDALEAASDGTVEDDAIGRPPSRPTGSTQTATIEQNRPPDLDRYKTRHESAFLPPSNHPHAHMQSKPAPSAFYPSSSRSEYPVQHPHPPPPQQSQSQPQSHRSWEQSPYHHSAQHHQYPASGPDHSSRSVPGQRPMGHRRPSNGQPPPHGQHPHGLSQHGQPPHPHGQQPPQMGVFAAPSTPGFQGRTVYSAKREQELGLPPPRNRGRSDGPAFSGFPPMSMTDPTRRREDVPGVGTQLSSVSAQQGPPATTSESQGR